MAHEVPISGQVDATSFPFLLMDLHRNGATGSLKVDGPTYQKALYFRGGRILFGSSNDPRDQLGAILIEAGKISPEQLEDINTKVGPGSPLAKVLADSGFVSQRELSEAARAKVEQILSDVIAYTTGSFEFEDGVLPKGAIDLKLSSERLVLAAVRRISDRAFVLRHLGSLEVVLSPAPDPRSLLAEIQGDLGGLMDVLDGHATLKEAAAQTRLDEFDAAKIACALLFLSLLQRAGASDDVSPFFVSEGTLPAETERTLPFGSRPASQPILHEEPLSDPAAFAPPAEVPTLIVGPAKAEPVRPIPGPEPPPETTREKQAEAAPTIIASAPTLIAPRPDLSAAGATAKIKAVPTPPDPPAPSAHDTSSPSEARRVPRASAADMAAVDALLNSRSFEGPMDPFERPSEGQRSPQQSNRMPRVSASASSSGPWLVGTAVVALLAGAALWFFVLRPAPGKPIVRTSPLRTVPPPATTLAALAPPVTAPPPSAPTASGTPGRPTTPTTTLAAVVETPAPKPVASKAPAHTGAKSLEEARNLMRQGSLADASEAFAAHVRHAPESYSIQIMVACSDDTVEKALSNASAQELFILPTHYKGKSCFRLCWGIYENEGRAGSALAVLPEYFRRGGASPKVVRTSTILP
jgi:septal ring-binding cell division protein DamX